MRGFTLVEVLVAAAVATFVLAAAFGWLWNVAARTTTSRAASMA